MLSNQKGTFSVIAVIEFHTDAAQLEPKSLPPTEASNGPSALERRGPEINTLLVPNRKKLSLDGLKAAGSSYETISVIEATMATTETATP